VLYAEIGMALAVAGTLMNPEITSYRWILIPAVIGSGIGIAMAALIPMTKMPERIALSHAFGGLAAALVLYFFTVDYVWTAADSLNERSNRIESALRDGKVRGKWISGEVREAVVALGPVSVPRAEGAGTEALGMAIREVFEANGVSAYSLDVRPGAPLPPTALRDVAGPSERIERLVGELRFTTTPDALAKIVAGLESRPEVESISRLKLAKLEADRKVQASMTVEAWIRVPKRRTG